MILLDTHALIWLDQDDGKLGETAMLTARNRIRMSLPVTQWRRDLLVAGLQEIAIDSEVAVTAAALDIDHGDPADRFIISTALLIGATLVTADQKLLDWRGPVKAISTH